jgi:hypothetical protein
MSPVATPQSLPQDGPEGVGRRKLSDAQSAPICLPLEEEVHGQQPPQTLTAPPRSSAKIPSDPPCGGALDLRHGLDESLDAGTLEEPQTEAIRHDGDDARAIEEALLQGRKPPHRIAQHAHRAHCSEHPGSVEAGMLLELELAIKEEPKVAPNSLGAQRGVPREGA